jgi:hypothetical protein
MQGYADFIAFKIENIMNKQCSEMPTYLDLREKKIQAVNKYLHAFPREASRVIELVNQGMVESVTFTDVKKKENRYEKRCFVFIVNYYSLPSETYFL